MWSCKWTDTFECLKAVNDGRCWCLNIDIKGNSMLSGAALTKYSKEHPSLSYDDFRLPTRRGGESIRELVSSTTAWPLVLDRRKPIDGLLVDMTDERCKILRSLNRVYVFEIVLLLVPRLKILRGLLIGILDFGF